MKKENKRFIILLAMMVAALAVVAIFPTKMEAANAPDEHIIQIYDVPLDADLQVYINNLGGERDIEPSLITAVIGKESAYDEHAIGDNGNAFGLMQVWPTEHEDRMIEYGVTDLLEPYGNILIGVDYLDYLLDQHRGVEWALTAYNAGIPQADFEAALGITNDYVETVLKIQEDLENEKN